jgi:hypothetical protein
MAVVKELVLALVFVLVATAVQSATEEDYPEIELPGVVLPARGFKKLPNVDPCCLPNQWQGNITGKIETPGGRDGGRAISVSNVAIFVDQTGKRIAAKGDEGGRFRNTSGGIVILFGDTKADLYFFDVDAQKCKHIERKNATFKKQCIPANSTVREITLGPVNGGLKVQAWRFRGKTPQDRRGLQVSVCGTIMVADKCLPVAVSDRGMIRRRPRSDEDINAITFDQSEDDVDADRKRPSRGGGKFSETLFYSSVKDSIDDTSVFTPPTYCNATTTIMASDALLYEEDNTFLDVLERFVSF